MDSLKTLFNREINPTNWSPSSSIKGDYSEKVIIVTGGNAGLGYQTVLELAKLKPKRIFLTARSKSKYDEAMLKIQQQVPGAEELVTYVEMDLASFASIKTGVDAIARSTDRIDVLINNAGIMTTAIGSTKEGYEHHFGTNHMGHALLVKLLMPQLLQTADLEDGDVRIINVSSTASMSAPSSGFDAAQVTTDMKNAGLMLRYGQSKYANLLHASELARKYPSILSVSLHPGRVGTGLLDETFKRGGGFTYFQKFYDWTVTPMTVERGAWNQLWCATAPRAELKSGAYYVPVGKLAKDMKTSREQDQAKKLWDWQEAEFAKLGYV